MPRAPPPNAEAASAIVEKTLTKAAVEAAGVKIPAPAPAPAPAPSAPPPRKPWEKNRTKFGPTHLTVLTTVEEKVKGEADEWRAVLKDALKHVVTIIDFVPFNATFATRPAQGKVKEDIMEFIEMLDILKEDANSGFPTMSGKPLHADDTGPLAQLIVSLCGKIVSPSNPVNEDDWQNVMQLIEVAQNSLKKQSTRAAGLQSWYETTAQEAKAKEAAEVEAKTKKAADEEAKRAAAEAKEKEYQEQVAKRKAEFAEKQAKAREEEAEKLLADPDVQGAFKALEDDKDLDVLAYLKKFELEAAAAAGAAAAAKPAQEEEVEAAAAVDGLETKIKKLGLAEKLPDAFKEAYIGAKQKELETECEEIMKDEEVIKVIKVLETDPASVEEKIKGDRELEKKLMTLVHGGVLQPPGQQGPPGGGGGGGGMPPGMMGGGGPGGGMGGMDPAMMQQMMGGGGGMPPGMMGGGGPGGPGSGPGGMDPQMMQQMMMQQQMAQMGGGGGGGRPGPPPGMRGNGGGPE